MSHNVTRVKEIFSQYNLICEEIGVVTKDMKIEIVYNSKKIIDENQKILFQLEVKLRHLSL